jgi:hypothetical protein
LDCHEDRWFRRNLIKGDIMITNRGKKGMRAILAVFGLFLVAAAPPLAGLKGS